MEKTTTTCSAHGHPEFFVEVDHPAVPDVDLDWMVGYLEATVAEGAVYKPGELVQIGFGLARVAEHPGGMLTLEEPDWQILPVNWVPGVSLTLLHLRLQKGVLESVGLVQEMNFPTIQHSLIVCNRAPREKGIFLNRMDEEGSDSGWFLGCTDEDHDHNNPEELRAVSLFELGMAAPELLEYLALPVGCLVILEGDAPEIAQGEHRLDFLPGSYLAMKHGT